MKNKVCCIFNYAPHYRIPIFKKLEEEVDCDFYFGDYVDGNIKKIEYNKLSNFKREIRNIKLPLMHFKWQKEVIKLCFNKKYNHFILTGDTSYLSTLVILIINRILGKKSYLWMHGLKSEPNLKSKILNYPFFHLANYFFLYGQYSKNILVKEGFKEDKIKVIYNSLNYEYQKNLRLNLVSSNIYSNYFKNNNKTIIYIGRIQKVKRIDLLIEAIWILKQSNIDINLVIVGSDNEGIKLEDLVIKKGIQNQVWFYGGSYNEQINAELIFNADLCVSPGNIGLTSIHSMTYGTPCISHNDFTKQMPEFEIIEPNKTGNFFKSNDLLDLTKKIKEWFELNIEREVIRKDCYQKVDQFYNPNYQVEIIKNTILNESFVDS